LNTNDAISDFAEDERAPAAAAAAAVTVAEAGDDEAR
jgi:hypothetical protein